MTSESNWAGKRLGLPESGTGSLAKMGRRVAAILIDWGISTLVGYAIFQSANSQIQSDAQYQAALTAQNLTVNQSGTALLNLTNNLNVQYTGTVFIGSPLQGQNTSSNFIYDTGSGYLATTSVDCGNCATKYYD